MKGEGDVKNLIRKVLLKIECIERATLAHQAKQDVKAYHENWAQFMRSGNAVQEEEPVVDYSDTRMMGQRQVVPVFIDSTNWGGM